MKFMNSLNRNEWNIQTLFRSTLFFVVYYLLVWLWVNPTFIFHEQNPVFLTGVEFFKEFFSYPGGFTEYISLLLSQLYFLPWLGAIVLTIIVWLITILTGFIIKSIVGLKRVQLLHFIPAILLLILHSNYDYTLTFTIGLLFSLLFLTLYIKLSNENIFWRLLFFTVSSSILFYISAGPVVVFALLSFFYDLMKGRQIIIGLINLAFVAVITIFAPNFYIITTEGAFANLLPFSDEVVPNVAKYALYLFYPLILLLIIGKNRIANRPKKKYQKKKSKEGKISLILVIDYFQRPILFNIVSIMLVATLASSSYLLFNNSVKEFLEVDYYAKQENWEKVLGLVEGKSSENFLYSVHTNRALYHTGELSSKMFLYPQSLGVRGLYIPLDQASKFPLQRSDLFFEMGHLNEAKHWAYEAYSLNENSPSALQRLALIYFIKDQPDAAKKCLNILKKTLLYKGWAEKHEKYIGNNDLILSDDKLKNPYLWKIETDFIVNTQMPSFDFDALLKQNNSNKTAFEYLMAYYLMERQLGNFINRLEFLTKLDYKEIPKHYEEAYLIYRLQGGKIKPNLSKLKLKLTTLQQFKDFRKIYKKHSGNKIAAQSELSKKFSKTYWYYYLYGFGHS